MKNQKQTFKLVPLILYLLIITTTISCSKENDKIEIFLVENTNLSPMKEIDPQSVTLDLKILSEKDIVDYDKATFTFKLTSESSSRLNKMDLSGKLFCVVKGDRKLLVGWFWECSSSLGMNGFVTLDFMCSNSEKLEIGYCLRTKDYPNENDPRKEITIANN